MRNVPPGFGVGIFGPRLVLVGRFGRYGLLGGSMSRGQAGRVKALSHHPSALLPLQVRMWAPVPAPATLSLPLTAVPPGLNGLLPVRNGNKNTPFLPWTAFVTVFYQSHREVPIHTGSHCAPTRQTNKCLLYTDSLSFWLLPNDQDK